MKRKERFEDVPDSSSFEDRDAATTLSKLLHGFAMPLSSPSPSSESRPLLLKWIHTRKRSSRIKRVDSSSDDLPGTTSDNPPHQGSECSSSPVGDSQSVVTLANVDEEPWSSEEEKCLGAHLGPSKVVSDSSNASPESESPTSTLPPAGASQFFPIPKFAESLSERSSAFQKVVPVRPVKKPKVCRKLKVEQITFESPIREPPVISFLQDSGIVKSEPAAVEVETRLPGRLTQRIGGKPKPALSESEKEARKQRRVQANRESARQTIRRKQELCEDLSKRAQHLAVENETIRKDVELLQLAVKNFMERNAYLKNQVEKCATARERGTPLTTTSAVEMPVSLVQFPFSQTFGGVGLRAPYLWPSTVPKSADSFGPIAGEINAPLGTTFANSPGAFWFGPGGNPGQLALLPHFFSHRPQSSVSRSPVASADNLGAYCPLMRTVSLPLMPGEPSCSIAPSGALRGFPPSNSLAILRSGNFADTSLCQDDLKTTGMKSEPSSLESTFNSRTHFFNSDAATQSGISSSSGGLLMRKLGEGSCVPVPKTPRQLLGRAHSLGASHMTKMMSSTHCNSGYTLGMLVPQERASMRDPDAQRAAAAATEARRRRKELTRSKSLQAMQQRQGARLAESSVS